MQKKCVEGTMNRHLAVVIAASVLLASCDASFAPQAQKTLQNKTGQPPAPPVAVAVALAPIVLKPAESIKADANTMLAERVKQALESETPVQAGAIDVTATSGGVVTLWGTAESDDERIRAARVAYRVQGVNTVNNRLAIVRGS
jgi:osmotically-inducible protein OsmY